MRRDALPWRAAFLRPSTRAWLDVHYATQNDRLRAVLGSGLAQAGAQEPTKRLVTGAVIVAAVVVDHFRHRREKAA